MEKSKLQKIECKWIYVSHNSENIRKIYESVIRNIETFDIKGNELRIACKYSCFKMSKICIIFKFLIIHLNCDFITWQIIFLESENH